MSVFFGRMSLSILANPAHPQFEALGEQTTWLVSPSMKFARDIARWANFLSKTTQ